LLNNILHRKQYTQKDEATFVLGNDYNMIKMINVYNAITAN